MLRYDGSTVHVVNEKPHTVFNSNVLTARVLIIVSGLAIDYACAWHVLYKICTPCLLVAPRPHHLCLSFGTAIHTAHAHAEWHEFGQAARKPHQKRFAAQ